MHFFWVAEERMVTVILVLFNSITEVENLKILLMMIAIISRWPLDGSSFRQRFFQVTELFCSLFC